METKELMPGTDLRTRFYIIQPKFVILNELAVPINVFQTGCTTGSLQCVPGAKASFHWTDVNKLASIYFTMEGVRATDNIDMGNLGSVVQQLVDPGTGKFKDIVRIDRYIDKGIRYVRIKKESAEHPCYIIQNESEYVTVGYKEKQSNFGYQYLDCESKVPFGWVYPEKAHTISLKFLWGHASKRPVLVSDKVHDVSMDDIKKYAPIDLPLAPRYGKYIWVTLESDGNSKILRIRDIDRKHEVMEKKGEQAKTISIDNIGVSVVSTYASQKCEILYLNLQKVEVAFAGDDKGKEITLLLKNLQIDNQLKEQSSFPVILYRAPKVDIATPFVRVICKVNMLVEPKANFYAFDSVQVEMVPFVIKLEEDHVVAMTDFLNHFKVSTTKHRGPENPPEAENETAISIESLRVSELQLNIWYKPSLEAKKSGNSLAKSLAAAFLNVKELPITLEPMLFGSVYGKVKTIALMVIQDYKELLESKKLDIIAGVLFAPLKDVSHLGTGVTNFLAGPMGGAKGVVSGTGSLVKGAVVGTFGTASGVTSAMSQGILALSADEEYIKEKQTEDEKHKPSNVIEGVGFGLFSVLKSVGSGLAGVITKPIEGAAKGGVSGFFKGAGQGLAGAVTKPISGGLDLLSKTAEGVRNTTTAFDEEANMMRYVRSLDEGRFVMDNFLDLYYEKTAKNLVILLMTEERIVCIKGERVVWELSTNLLKLAEVDGSQVILHYANDKNVGQKTIKVGSEAQAREVREKLSQIIQQ